MLIDDVKDFLKTRPVLDSESLESFKHATAINAQNVADYMFQSPAPFAFDHNNYPNVAPPIDDIWMEWIHKNHWGLDEDGDELFPASFRIGVLLRSTDLHNFNSQQALAGLSAIAPACDKSKIHWLTTATIFMKLPHGIVAAPSIGWVVMSDGQFAKTENGIITSYDARLFSRGMDGTPGETSLAFLCLLRVAFMTLSFMHCRNVELIQGPIPPPRLQKARVSKGKEPLVRWNTITIEPVRRVVSSANGGNPELSAKSLHVCRGHFKHFTDRGLFGKYRGTYWWPQSLRGSAQAGVVMKDYVVKPHDTGSAL